MKITNITKPSKRTFTFEFSEDELILIAIMVGQFSTNELRDSIKVNAGSDVISLVKGLEVPDNFTFNTYHAMVNALGISNSITHSNNYLNVVNITLFI